MQNDGIAPDLNSFACDLKECDSVIDNDKGRKIYETIVDKEMLEKKLYSRHCFDGYVC